MDEKPPAVVAAVVLDHAVKLSLHAENISRVVDKYLARVGRIETVVLTVKQPEPDRLFHVSQMPGKGGLRQVEAVSGSGEALFFDDGGQIFQYFCVKAYKAGILVTGAGSARLIGAGNISFICGFHHGKQRVGLRGTDRLIARIGIRSPAR